MSDDQLSQKSELVYRYDSANRRAVLYGFWGSIFLTLVLTSVYQLNWSSQAKLIFAILLAILAAVIILYLWVRDHSNRVEFYEDRIRIFADDKPIDVQYLDLDRDWKENSRGALWLMIKVPAKRDDGTDYVAVRKILDLPIKGRKDWLSDFMLTK